MTTEHDDALFFADDDAGAGDYAEHLALRPSRGALHDAIEKWRQQEHDTRVLLMGDHLADELEQLVRDAGPPLSGDDILRLAANMYKIGYSAGRTTRPYQARHAIDG